MGPAAGCGDRGASAAGAACEAVARADVEDSRWLARVCQFGLGRPSVVPDRQFHASRSLNRHRRSLVQERARLPNQVQKTIDRAGVRIGGIISNVIGVNGRFMLEGLVAGDSREAILSRLSSHVSGKLAALGSALSLSLADRERAVLADLMTAGAALQGRLIRHQERQAGAAGSPRLRGLSTADNESASESVATAQPAKDHGICAPRSSRPRMVPSAPATSSWRTSAATSPSGAEARAPSSPAPTG